MTEDRKRLWLVTYTASGGEFRKHWLVESPGPHSAKIAAAMFETDFEGAPNMYSVKPVEMQNGVAVLIEEERE